MEAGGKGSCPPPPPQHPWGYRAQCREVGRNLFLRNDILQSLPGPVELLASFNPTPHPRLVFGHPCLGWGMPKHGEK